MNAQIKKPAANTPAKEIAGRVQTLDWERVSQELDAQGCAAIARFITAEECKALVALFPVDNLSYFL